MGVGEDGHYTLLYGCTYLKISVIKGQGTASQRVEKPTQCEESFAVYVRQQAKDRILNL